MVVFALASRAQSHWGVRGGLNETTTQGPGYTNLFAWNYHAGIFYEAPFGKRFSLLAEALYSPKGNYAGGDLFLRLKYISVPLLAEYRLVGRLYVLGGLEGSYLLCAYTTSDLPDLYANGVYRRIDIGIAGGWRYAITKNIGIDLRAIKGLMGIERPYRVFSDGSTGTVDNKDNPRNLAFQAGLYYILLRRR